MQADDKRSVFRQTTHELVSCAGIAVLIRFSNEGIGKKCTKQTREVVFVRIVNEKIIDAPIQSDAVGEMCKLIKIVNKTAPAGGFSCITCIILFRK